MARAEAGFGRRTGRAEAGTRGRRPEARGGTHAEAGGTRWRARVDGGGRRPVARAEGDEVMGLEPMATGDRAGEGDEAGTGGGLRGRRATGAEASEWLRGRGDRGRQRPAGAPGCGSKAGGRGRRGRGSG